MSENRTMNEVISSLLELIESADSIEDIEALLRLEKMFDRRFKSEPLLFSVKRDFCTELYAHRLKLMV